jgi:hypothetical protein
LQLLHARSALLKVKVQVIPKAKKLPWTTKVVLSYGKVNSVIPAM